MRNKDHHREYALFNDSGRMVTHVKYTGGITRVAEDMWIVHNSVQDTNPGCEAIFWKSYGIINSKGVVINNPVEDLQIDSLINIKVYNDIGLEVFNSDMTYQNLSDVDNNAYINQDNFLLSVQSPILKGSIGIRVDGGYYEISGFDLNLTLK